MAIARLLIAGVMVAGGLVLGAFAALGYLDPNWTQNQLAVSEQARAWRGAEVNDQHLPPDALRRHRNRGAAA